MEQGKKEKHRGVDVVVLMAGEGRRLLPLTKDRPKGLLCCDDGASIFTHMVQSFVVCHQDVTFIPVIGHGSAKVNEEINRLNHMAEFSCVYNPFYANSGPLVSLWLGLIQSKQSRVIIVNGDTLIKEDLVKNIVPWIQAEIKAVNPEVGLCVSSAENFEKDDMKVLLDNSGCFRKTGKDIDTGRGVMKSAGVLCIRDIKSKNIIKDKLNQLLMEGNPLEKTYYWHNLLNEAAETFQVDLISVDLNSWCEVDTLVDLKSMI